VAALCGDDYELVFTASPKSRGRLREVARLGGVVLTRIGTCTSELTVQITGDGDGQPSEPLPRGFGHFR
jgi:thiamine monophosphate kinase